MASALVPRLSYTVYFTVTLYQRYIYLVTVKLVRNPVETISLSGRNLNFTCCTGSTVSFSMNSPNSIVILGLSIHNPEDVFPFEN